MSASPIIHRLCITSVAEDFMLPRRGIDLCGAHMRCLSAAQWPQRHTTIFFIKLDLAVEQGGAHLPAFPCTLPCVLGCNYFSLPK